MKWKKTDWKIKVLLSILIGVMLVITLLFGITYGYFLNILEKNNEKIAHLSFRKSEEKLKDMLEQADKNVNIFTNTLEIWDFTRNCYQSDIDKTYSMRQIIAEFDKILSSYSNIYGISIVNGDGRTLVSTAEKKSRSGNTTFDESMKKLILDSCDNYPYMLWTTRESLNLQPDDALYPLVNQPVILGIKALNEMPEPENDSYILVTICEDEVQKCYNQTIYNDSQTVLLDESGIVISSTLNSLLNTPYIPEKQNQNISYDLAYNNWKFVNIIPKKSYLSETKKLLNFGMFIAFLAFLLVIYISAKWSKRYIRPIQLLIDNMEWVGKEHFDIEKPAKEGWPELDHLNMQFYLTVQKLKDYIERLRESEKEKSREELLALQYQINPHFLYNSLNDIRWIAMMTNNTKAADSIVVLSRIIMPLLRNPSFTWHLSDELEFLENYITIMKLRYGETFEYHMECEEQLYHDMFPRLILQPIVENCFVHGKCEQGITKISGKIKKEQGRFFISIQNNGSFISAEKLKQIQAYLESDCSGGTSIGLSNIRKRLKYLYGNQGSIRMESTVETGFTVYIEL